MCLIKVMAQRTMTAYPQLKLKIAFHFNKQIKQTLCPSVFHIAISFEDRYLGNPVKAECIKAYYGSIFFCCPCGKYVMG